MHRENENSVDFKDLKLVILFVNPIESKFEQRKHYVERQQL
jgi:hypothetical protein